MYEGIERKEERRNGIKAGKAKIKKKGRKGEEEREKKVHSIAKLRLLSFTSSS